MGYHRRYLATRRRCACLREEFMHSVKPSAKRAHSSCAAVLNFDCDTPPSRMSPSSHQQAPIPTVWQSWLPPQRHFLQLGRLHKAFFSISQTFEGRQSGGRGRSWPSSTRYARHLPTSLSLASASCIREGAYAGAELAYKVGQFDCPQGSTSWS